MDRLPDVTVTSTEVTVDAEDVVDQLDIDDLIIYLGVGVVLDAIGIEECKSWFGLVEPGE